MALIKKYIIKTKLHLETGLHIGSSSDNVEIGGVDNPVIRRTSDNSPYIPGSSLKGKIRSLLEQMNGISEIGEGEEKEFSTKSPAAQKINLVFGFAKDKKPSKLIVRDSYLEKDSKTELEDSEYTDMPYTEIKSENRIDRVYGTASDPRRMERVPAGVKFNVEFIINVWDRDEDGQKSLKLLKEGLKALEFDYLGGSGSRGYGKVKFDWNMIENFETIDMKNLVENE